jgi:hypothetical protein
MEQARRYNANGGLIFVIGREGGEKTERMGVPKQCLNATINCGPKDTVTSSPMVAVF